ncbi:type II secretion system F family protein [Pelagicoccus albus]|uniref:Type II secretion system F family protein n=1 Tax=Pelagicoccus albus TaxID=415222 RepID=A0A7X1B484_9BACT|nr:type II secretion system F family protein [Pelagicoccus albus]MBC2605124.1 type II secretion system F family protein [Pelagicoccus albus]
MSKLSDARLADWLDQVGQGLESGLDASASVSFANDLPKGGSSKLQNLLESGEGWVDSLEKAGVPLRFSEFAILEASAQAGRLPSAMKKIADGRRELRKVKIRIRLALAYPIFLVHFAALVFSLSYLLDGDTRGFVFSVGVVVVPVWFLFSLGWTVATYWPQKLKALGRKLPLFSSYRVNWDAGTLCDVLSSCLAAGMEISKAWEIALVAADSPKLHRMGDAVLRSIASGQKASLGIKETSQCAPKGFPQLYIGGEETGQLEQNLKKAAERYFSAAKGKLLLASIFYPKILLLGIFGYVAYKIILFFSDYFQQLMDINA